jgi:hypothetical protein
MIRTRHIRRQALCVDAISDARQCEEDAVGKYLDLPVPGSPIKHDECTTLSSEEVSGYETMSRCSLCRLCISIVPN